MTSAADIDFRLTFHDAELLACASGVLYWPAERLLCVSDLHLGKALRYTGHGGAALPPYEAEDTLLRLEGEIERLSPKTIVCLGDSFDSPDSGASLPPALLDRIARMQAGRVWIWIEGNHDPGPAGPGGTHLAQFPQQPLVFRHIATDQGIGEVSGHYHPKAHVHTRARTLSRPCFVMDKRRVILPAFGTYTGGLSVADAALSSLFCPDEGLCVLTGKTAQPVPLKALLRGSRRPQHRASPSPQAPGDRFC